MTRLSLSPYPQARAALGCWRMLSLKLMALFCFSVYRYPSSRYELTQKNVLMVLPVSSLEQLLLRFRCSSTKIDPSLPNLTSSASCIHAMRPSHLRSAVLWLLLAVVKHEKTPPGLSRCARQRKLQMSCRTWRHDSWAILKMREPYLSNVLKWMK